MFSPISRILSIHYFTLNPYSLSDRKAYNEVNGYLEQQAQALTTDESTKFKVSAFLKNKKQTVQAKRSLEDFEIRNQMVPIVINILLLYDN